MAGFALLGALSSRGGYRWMAIFAVAVSLAGAVYSWNHNRSVMQRIERLHEQNQ